MRSRWSDADATGLDPLALRVYTSRLIGAEPSLVLFGGGNTSVKHTARDHLGRDVPSLSIKGSGSDLRTIETRHFAALRLDDLRSLRARDSMTDEAMVEFLGHCQLRSDAPRPSIETLLHAFLPLDWIDHSHADAVLALTNQPDGAATVRDALGDGVAVVPYLQPGFTLSKVVADAYDADPSVIGIVLDKHGLVTFGATARESYERHIELVTRAEDYARRREARHAPYPRTAPAAGEAARIAPVLRGRLARDRRVVVRFDGSPRVRAFVDRPDLSALALVGPATPDHVLRTKRLPLILTAREPEEIEAAVEGYAREYRAYVRRHQAEGGFEHDPRPRVTLVPGVGMFTAGASAAEADAIAGIYRHTMDVIESADAIGRYTALVEAELFAIEYWPLELYKLSLAPPERPLARRVALVTGAGRGIGRAIAVALASAGAFVLVTDVDADAAEAVRDEIEAAGDAADAIALDVAADANVDAAFDHAARAAGGVDIVVSNAGVADSAPIDRLDLATWRRSLDINATGHFLVCRAAVNQMRAQGLGGSIVLICTKNVFDPGAEFGAYSAAKAAELQLGRVLAIENGRHRIRVNMVNPDAVFGDSGLWSDELRRGRAAAHNVPESRLETYYAERNLLRVSVEASDVAQAVLFLASDRSAKTTGAVLPVDGGVRGAFPR